MRNLCLSLLIVVAVVVAGCAGGAGTASTPTPSMPSVNEAVTPTPDDAVAAETGQISIAGSTTVQPLAEKLAEVFVATNSGIRIDVAGGGSSSGVKAGGDRTVDIGMASREIRASELETYPDLQIYEIAFDGIAIVAHLEVPVDELTLDEVRGIFAGEITDWSEVGGPNQPITIISREEGSGTRGAFEELVMGETPITDRAIFQDSNGKVRTALTGTPYAIAYLSFGYVDDSVLIVAIDGVDPSVENVLNGSYPVVRPLNFVTGGEPESIVKLFLDWVFGDAGQAVVTDQGYIAVK